MRPTWTALAGGVNLMTRTLALPELVDAPPADDPFRYGFRTVLRAGPNGTTRSEMLPLTIWEFLHPQLGDKLSRGSRHVKELNYLTQVIEARLKSDERAAVFSDLIIHWDVGGLAHHAPDVAVVFNLRKQKNWTEFFVAVEGVRPELIIEVVSPHVREADTVVKMAEYHAALVPTYVLVDRESDEEAPTIRGYRWAPKAYEPLPFDDKGRLPLPKVGLCLGTDQRRVRLYDAVSGEAMLDYSDLVDALESAKQARKEAEEGAHA